MFKLFTFVKNFNLRQSFAILFPSAYHRCSSLPPFVFHYPVEQEHVATFLSHFQPILCSNCSPLSRILICTSYLPFCFHPPTIVVLPCRHLCSTIQTSCIYLFNRYGVPWQSRLICSHLPRSPQLCLSPQSPLPQMPKMPTLKKFTAPRKTDSSSSSSMQSSKPSTFKNVTASKTTHSPSLPSHRVILVFSFTVVCSLYFHFLFWSTFVIDLPTISTTSAK